MDLEAMKRELETNGSMQAVAQSDAAKKLMNSIDSTAVAQAAKSGDVTALKDILSRVLSTPEGKTLAEQVRKAAGKNE